jgi:hypothetical protein
MTRYTPTPRDLFNPPPQARVFSNRRQIERCVDIVREVYMKDYYDEKFELFCKILDILNEHDEHVFKGI